MVAYKHDPGREQLSTARERHCVQPEEFCHAQTIRSSVFLIAVRCSIDYRIPWLERTHDLWARPNVAGPSVPASLPTVL